MSRTFRYIQNDDVLKSFVEFKDTVLHDRPVVIARHGDYSLFLKYISDDDKTILDEVISKLGKMTKEDIISFMHKEKAYIETKPRDVIQFSYAESLQI